MTNQQLTATARLEAHALIDRLVADGDTFAPSDARRLIALLPQTKSTRFSVTGRFKGRGGRVKGHAAGIGPVEMKGEGREKRISLNAPAIHRIGGYEVTHTPGHIGIALLWHQSRLDRSGQSCALVYDAVTGEPQEMRIARQRTVQLLFLSLSYVSYAHWKTPGPEESPLR